MWWLMVGLCSLAGGCGKAPVEGGEKASEGNPASAPEAAPAVVHIAVGKFRLGSLPGDPGRDPSVDPLASEVELGPFRMDGHVARGNDGQPQLAQSLEEAEALCRGHAGRLCTEVEWERACRGEQELSLGAGPEWTASRFGPQSPHAGRAVIRGVQERGPDNAGCARRTPAEAAQKARVRCCYGAPNALRVDEPVEGPAFEPAQLSNQELRSLMKTHPRTAALADEAQLYPADAAATVFARGPGNSMGFELTTSPLLWQPGRGAKYLIVAGHSGNKTAFVLVYSAAPERRVLASSLIMKNEPGPVALGFSPSIRPRVHFSTCWGCPGETGKALFRPPESVVILQP
jgi:hypothetical protein